MHLKTTAMQQQILYVLAEFFRKKKTAHTSRIGTTPKVEHRFINTHVYVNQSL